MPRLLGRGSDGSRNSRTWWEVSALPFEDMPESEKDRLTSAFAGWLASLRSEAWVHGLLEAGSIELEGEAYEYRAPRFYIEAPEGSDPRSSGLRARPSLPPQRPWPLRDSRGMALLEGGLWARCVIVYELPPRTLEAALAVPGLWDEMHMQLKPLTSPSPSGPGWGGCNHF